MKKYNGKYIRDDRWKDNASKHKEKYSTGLRFSINCTALANISMAKVFRMRFMLIKNPPIHTYSIKPRGTLLTLRLRNM